MQAFHSPKNRAVAIAAGLAFVVALAGCKPAAKGGGRAARGQGIVPVQAATAVRKTLPVTQMAIGNVRPLRTVAVRSQVDGIIEKIHFREGDEVRAGDLLVTIDRRPFENTLRIARADLENALATQHSAEADLARYQSLEQASLVSQTDYEQYRTKAETARAQVSAKEAAVSNAELQLSYTEIRAPIDGRTGQLGLHAGALVKASDSSASLLVINQMAPISVAYSVPENTLAPVRAAAASSVNNAIRVTAVPRGATGSDAPPAEGRLDFIDNTVDPRTGTILLRAVFPNADHALWPGQFVNVTMELGHETGTILVPASAVQAGQKGRHVFVITGSKTAELRAVKTGRSASDLTVILSGVNEGETVVTDGQLRLTNGAKVEVKNLDDFLKTVPQ